MHKFNLQQVGISKGSYNDFVQAILERSRARVSAYICVANVHMFVEAARNPAFMDVLNQADIVTPDGMGLVLASKWLYGIRQERVAGMDLLPDLLEAAAGQHLSVFFFGGTQEMLEKTRDYTKAKYPGLERVDVYAPPFRPLDAAEEADVVQRINASGAHLVFVVLGCPKQEKWMASMKGRIHATMIGIGGALPVMIGLQKRAPGWMQRNTLEWLFRLYQEPRRLMKRYFVTNNLFIYMMMKEKVKLVSTRGKPVGA